MTPIERAETKKSQEEGIKGYTGTLKRIPKSMDLVSIFGHSLGQTNKNNFYKLFSVKQDIHSKKSKHCFIKKRRGSGMNLRQKMKMAENGNRKSATAEMEGSP